MENGFFLITGTSRGIGEALAARLLATGNTVLGISRGQSGRLKSTKYHHLLFDLAETRRIHQIVEKAFEIVRGQDFDLLCLVSNASAVEPMRAIGKCPPIAIETHVKIGLIAPMILTSGFMRTFYGQRVRKKVALISSVSAIFGFPDGSIYCSCKAALNMFVQCVGLEQISTENLFEIVAIDPGMVNTSMQQAVRSKPSNEFAPAALFRQAFNDGKLQKPDDVARRIHAALRGRYEQGTFIRLGEL